MQSAGIHIPIDAINNASPVIRQVAADVSGLEQSAGQAANSAGALSGNVVSLNAAMDVASRVAGVVRDSYQELVGVTVEYANDVRTLRDVTGQSAEESSRLIQFMDDYKISADAMSLATKKLAKDDLPMNIDTLAMLSDEFLRLDKGVERTDFLYEKFGKQGDKFAEVMLLGRDAILEQNDAISKNLILTDESLQQAREYEMGLDTLNDSWMALKITLGNEIIPVANEVIEGMNQTNEIRELANELIRDGVAGNREEALSLAETALEYGGLVDKVDQASSARWNGLASMYETITATEELAGAASTMVIADKEAVEGAIKVQEAYEKHGEKLADLQLDHDELLLKKKELNDQGWKPESEKIQDVNDKLADNEEKQRDVVEAMKGTLEQMLINTAMAGLDAEAQLALARSLGMIDESAYAALSAQEKLKGQYEDGTITADEYAKKTMELKGAVDRLESKNITITADAIFNEVRNVFTNYSENATQTQVGSGNKWAEGTDGWMTVPSGYPNDTYPILLTSGERFAVIPEGAQASPASAGGFGGGGNTFIYSPSYGMSFGDENEAVNRMYPAFLQMLDKARADGRLS